jgi:hypothetical protein
MAYSLVVIKMMIFLSTIVEAGGVAVEDGEEGGGVEGHVEIGEDGGGSVAFLEPGARTNEGRGPLFCAGPGSLPCRPAALPSGLTSYQGVQVTPLLATASRMSS